MQIADTSSSSHLNNHRRFAMKPSTSIDREVLKKLAEKDRSMLQPEHMLLKHNNEDVINMSHLKQNQKGKLQKTKPLEERIVINISGARFETLKSTLEKYPKTLLGNEKHRSYYYDQVYNEYFFDRHRLSFEAILYYYQSAGRLYRPKDVPLDVFLYELAFFDLDKEVFAQIRNDENLAEMKNVTLPNNRFRRYIWTTLEYPEFSLLAKIIHILSFIIIIIATVGLAIETLPQYDNLADEACKDTVGYANNSITTSSKPNNNVCLAYFSSPFVMIQTVCVVIFTLELIVRLICMPSLCDFIKNPMNWVDVFSIIPYYVMICIRLSGQKMDSNSPATTALGLTRVLSFARVFKFYRIFKNVKAIRILVLTMQSSLFDFFILITTLTLMATLFGAGAYFFENIYGSKSIDSLPEAIYWGIITITTVGYGDIVLITWGGRMIACLCALTGTCIVAMLVSVLVERYQRLFTRKIYVQPENTDYDNDYSDIDMDELVVGHQNRSSIESARNKQPENLGNHKINDAVVKNKNDDQTKISSPLNSIDQKNNEVPVKMRIVHDFNNDHSYRTFDTVNSLVLKEAFPNNDNLFQARSNSTMV